MDVSKNPDGSHFPPYNEDWDEDTQLEWYVGCVNADTGLRIDLRHRSQTGVGLTPEQLEAIPEKYHLTVRGPRTLASQGPMDFHSAWAFLDGVRATAHALNPQPEAASR